MSRRPASVAPLPPPTPPTVSPMPMSRHRSSEADDFLAHILRVEAPAFDPTLANQQRRFVPEDELQRYLDEATIRKLLVKYKLDPTEASAVRGGYVVVFTILIRIRRAECISAFICDDRLADEHLPLLSDAALPHDCKALFADFYEAQWQFCAQRLRQDRLNDTKLHEKRILPITAAEPISGEGPDSRTYKVTIHPAYNSLVDKEKDAHATTNVFLLKTCPARLVHHHRDEVFAYKTMGNQRDVSVNMLRFYGSWRQGDTYSMLLEYVDGGTLEQYFQQNTTPTSSEDILMFWERMFDLVKLLARIHLHEDPHDRHMFLQGIHHDIKPSNILVKKNQNASSRFDVTFKLADFGLADFQRSTPIRGEARRRDVNGTQMYSAPECFRDERDHSAPHAVREASPIKDVWSMGCVLSEAAVWSVLLREGLDEYRNGRTAATNQISGLVSTAYTGCFHDGERTLAVVYDMHEKVRKGRRACDEVIEDVINIIDDMLVAPDQRRPALWFYEKFSRRTMRNAKPSAGPSGTLPWPPVFQITSDEKPARPLPPELPHDFSTDPLGIKYNYNDPMLLDPTPRRSSGYEIARKPPLPPTSFQEQRPRPASYSGYSADTKRDGGKSSLLEHGSQHGSYGSPSAPRHIRGESGPTLGRGASDMLSGHTPSMNAPIPLESSHGSQAMKEYGLTPPKPTVMQTSCLPKEELPNASIDVFEKWIANQKRGSTAGRPPGYVELSRLNGRDQIFIFDNSKSMRRHWRECKRVFRVLAYLVKEKDPDGIEIRFTSDPSWQKRNKNRAPLLECLDATEPGGQFTPADTLCEILDSYDWKFTKRGRFGSSWLKGKKKFGVNIYVFTDGAWQEGDGCLKEIAEAIQKLLGTGVEARQIGIQFVQFGNDEEGTRRLEILDNGLDKFGVLKDIIDTERHDGNVFKMLLGGSSRLWDGDSPKSPKAPATAWLAKETAPDHAALDYIYR